MQNEIIDASVSGKATQVGAGTAMFAWAISQEVLGLIGVIVAVVGLSVNWYYKAKEDRRAQAEHDKVMEE